MSRYVDVDAFLEDNKEFADREIEHPRYQETVRELIDSAPSIDIVRCKECKHNPWNVRCDYTCVWDDDFADRPQTPDDFCSYGEREGE